MRARPFVLSFVLTGLVLCPLLLTARAPKQKRPDIELGIAPRFPTPQATVSGSSFQAEVVEHKGNVVTIRVTGENTGKEDLAAALGVAVLRERPMAMMARMVPPPERVAERELAVHLAPGEKLNELLTFEDARFAKPKADGKDAPKMEMAVPGMDAAPAVMASLAVKPAAAAVKTAQAK